MTDYLAGLDVRGIWESAPDAMLLVGRDGVVLLANDEACRLFGYQDGMDGRSIENLVPVALAGSHAALRAEYHASPRRRAMGAGLRLEASRQDGSVFPVQISLSPLGADLVIAAVRDVSSVVAAEERQVDSARRRILAEDHERIAKDMHDNVIQELFALGMSLQATVASIPDAEQAARVEAGVERLDDVIRSIRSLIFDIRRDGDSKSDLRMSVVEIATSLIPSLGFEPSVSFDGAVDAVSAEIREHVLAVARESLTNVARHADADAAAIEVSNRSGTVTVVVTDNGVGMPATAEHRGGHSNMSERARLVRGSFTVHAEPDGGTTLRWQAPEGS